MELLTLLLIAALVWAALAWDNRNEDIWKDGDDE